MDVAPVDQGDVRRAGGGGLPAPGLTPAEPPASVDDPPTQPLPLVPTGSALRGGQVTWGQPAPVDPWAPPPPGAVESPPGQPPPPVVTGHWSAVDVLAGLGVVLLLSQLLGWPFAVWAHAPTEVRLIVAGFLPIWIGLGGAAVVASRIRGTGRLGDDLGLRLRPVDLAIGLGLGIGLRIASGVIAVLVQTLFGRAAQGNLDQITGGGLSRTLVLLNLLVAGSLIAPFIEELFFRGLLVRSVAATLTRRNQRRGRPATPDRVGRVRRATFAASAVLFALLHLGEVGDVVSAAALIPTLLLVGVLHSMITWRTGRLGAALVSHAVFNASAALLVLAR